MKILSIIITSNRFGHVASLRFSNRFRDIEMSATYKELLYRNIEGYVRKVGAEWA